MNLADLIVTLKSILETEGNIPVVHGDDMSNGVPIDLVKGADVAEPDKYPKGFLHIGG